jgi:MerR family transcriptional regulator, redox-sensitive transcriptional activator SoxR
MTETEIGIGRLADRAGVSVTAIRYYERRGLLPAPERVGGQRRYPEETVRRLEIIAVAKRAGFSLEEIRVLLTATDRGEPADERLRALATRKLPDVEALITHARSMRDWLAAAGECGCQSLEACPLFDGAGP